MAKLIIKHDQAIQMHSEFYDKDFEVVKMSVCGFMDNALFAIPSGVYGLVMCISGIFVINFSKKKLSKG